MKKTSKPATKKPIVKKSSFKPKRKAEVPSQLSQLVTRLEIVADKLAQAAEHFTQAEMRQPHTNEHVEQADDIEIGGRDE